MRGVAEVLSSTQNIIIMSAIIAATSMTEHLHVCIWFSKLIIPAESINYSCALFLG